MGNQLRPSVELARGAPEAEEGLRPPAGGAVREVVALLATTRLPLTLLRVASPVALLGVAASPVALLRVGSGGRRRRRPCDAANVGPPGDR